MTIDEAIKRAEEVAEEMEKAAKEWHENQVRKCELLRRLHQEDSAKMDYTHENECIRCAEDHRQLAEWLKELKAHREKQPCDDCISREAVDELSKALVHTTRDKADFLCNFWEGLQKLPSVTPQPEKCGDFISRKAVIDTIFAECSGVKLDIDFAKVLLLQRAIKDLPPVTPQPKIGKWILKHRTHNAVRHYTGQDEIGETHTISVLERYEVDEPYCSECGKLAGDTSQDYCCACGAKIEEVNADDSN